MVLDCATEEQYCSLWPLVAIKLVARVRSLEFKLAEHGLFGLEWAAVRPKLSLKLELGSSVLYLLQTEIQVPGSDLWLRFDWR